MDLFVLNTPFQLLGAFEAMDAFSVEERIVLIQQRDDGDSAHGRQLRTTAALLGFDDAIWYPRVAGRVSAGQTAQLARCIRDRVGNGPVSRPFERTFIGEVRLRQFRMLAATLIAQVNGGSWILDDGTQTISHVRTIRERGYWKPSGSAILRLVRSGRDFFLHDLHDPVMPRFRLFTCFDFLPDKGLQIVRHDFGALRKRFDITDPQEGLRILLGSPAVEDGAVSADVYRLSVARLLSRFEGTGSVQYYPHRRENPEKLRVLTEAFPISIAEPEYPVEIELLTRRLYPVEIAAFASTALFTLSRIFPGSRIVNGTFPQETISPSHVDQYKRFNAYFADYLETGDT